MTCGLGGPRWALIIHGCKGHMLLQSLHGKACVAVKYHVTSVKGWLFIILLCIIRLLANYVHAWARLMLSTAAHEHRILATLALHAAWWTAWWQILGEPWPTGRPHCYTYKCIDWALHLQVHLNAIQCLDSSPAQTTVASSQKWVQKFHCCSVALLTTVLVAYIDICMESAQQAEDTYSRHSICMGTLFYKGGSNIDSPSLEELVS